MGSLKKLRPALRELVVDDIAGNMQHTRRCRGIAPLTVDDVKEMAKCPRVTIGAHSDCHNILTQIDDEAMRASVTQSKKLLESWIGRSVKYFAFPNGDFDERVVSAVKTAGFEVAATSTGRPWLRDQDLFELPRVAVGRYDSQERFKLMMATGNRRVWR